MNERTQRSAAFNMLAIVMPVLGFWAAYAMWSSVLARRRGVDVNPLWMFIPLVVFVPAFVLAAVWTGRLHRAPKA